MREFEISTAHKIIFRTGGITDLAQEARLLGTRPLLIVGNGKNYQKTLEQSGILGDNPCVPFTVSSEPDLDLVQQGIQTAREYDIDILIAVGGGSAIDTAKAIAGLVSSRHPLRDYFEVIGNGRQIEGIPLPVIAVPTTAGTGAEVTRNAVISVPGEELKVSLRSPQLFPRLALIDPGLTTSLSQRDTADTGMDALTQLIEPLFSKKCNAFVEAICKDGIHHAVNSLDRAYQYGDDINAREGMSYASLLSGIALTNAGLGAVHGFAAALGGMLRAPHGAICAALLPHVLEANEKAIREREPDNPILQKFDSLPSWMNIESDLFPGALEWITKLSDRLSIRPLSSLGLQRSLFDEVVDRAVTSSSMKSNPINLTRMELINILERAF